MSNSLRTTAWYIIKSPILSARVEDISQAGELVRAEIRAIASTHKSTFRDDFNRADGSVGNGWISTPFVSVGVTISSGMLYAYTYGGNIEGCIYRALAVDSSNCDIFADVGVSSNATAYNNSSATNTIYLFRKNPVSSSDSNGLCVFYGSKYQNYGPSFGIRYNNADIQRIPISDYDSKPNKRIRITITKTKLKAKVWDIGTVEPNTYQIEAGISSYDLSGKLFTIRQDCGGTYALACMLDNLAIFSGGISVLYSLPAQTGNKITTSTALPINSAAESPTLSGIAGYLG
jgi:hypothetical protein